MIPVSRVISRSNLSRALARNQLALEHAIVTTSSMKASLRTAGERDLVNLVSVYQYFQFLNFDLSCLMSDLFTKRRRWHRVMHARHLALHAHECIEDSPKILGKPLSTLLSRIGCDRSHQLRARELLQALRPMRKKHAREIRRIRDLTAAHRVLDADSFVSVIDAIDPETALDLSRDLMAWLTDVLSYLASVVSTTRRRHDA
jgi:hypothetical protein